MRKALFVGGPYHGREVELPEFPGNIGMLPMATTPAERSDAYVTYTIYRTDDGHWYGLFRDETNILACCPECQEITHDYDCPLVGDGRPVEDA